MCSLRERAVPSGRSRGSTLIARPCRGASPHWQAVTAGTESCALSPDALVECETQQDDGVSLVSDDTRRLSAQQERVAAIARCACRQQQRPAFCTSSPQRHPGEGWPTGASGSPMQAAVKATSVSRHSTRWVVQVPRKCESRGPIISLWVRSCGGKFLTLRTARVNVPAGYYTETPPRFHSVPGRGPTGRGMKGDGSGCPAFSAIPPATSIA